MRKLKPIADRIVVRRIEAEAKSPGGIIIPDNAKEKPAEGVVVAVGDGRYDDKGQLVAMRVCVSDRVLFGKYSGTELRVDGEELVVMREDDVLCVVVKP
jgi:chaperonin GroES